MNVELGESGKLVLVYARNVLAICETWIPSTTVKEMAEAFERRDPEATIRDFEADDRPILAHSPEEVAEIAAFFRLSADQGLRLVGSW